MKKLFNSAIILDFISDTSNVRQASSALMGAEETVLGSLPAVLAHVRDLAGLTQREMAEALDVDHTTISKVENGRLRPGLEFVYNLDAYIKDANA